MTSENLQKWALTAEIVGGLAVLVTLIVLVLEVRDNTDALRLQEVRNLREIQARIFTMQFDNSDLFIKSYNEPENLTITDIYKLAQVHSYRRNLLQTAFDAYNSGIIELQDWERWIRTSPVYFGDPVSRVLYEEDKTLLNALGREDLVAEIDRALESGTIDNNVVWLNNLLELVSEVSN